MNLQKIQSELKVPKGQTNKFGGYKYRSCEDIVEAVKPVLAAHGAYLLLNDEIIEVGGRIYVQATATISDGTVLFHATACAREPLDRKGMDESQITGAASSYARKYALNGLFAIDDTKDADTLDNSQPVHRFKPGEKDELLKQVKTALESGDESGLKQILDEYSPEEKVKIWGIFTSQERSAIKELLK